MRPAADADPQAPPANGAERVEQVLRVEQSRIDRLMDLVGELVVAKNAPPCLARRAVRELGDREFARAIKSRRSALDRISNDMQNAMMAVRLVPVARRFQRFPRLVRDMSRKPGKDIRLAMEGQDTEADRTVIEALSEPLVHLVRNALDHGIEMPDLRQAAGVAGWLVKPATPEALGQAIRRPAPSRSCGAGATRARGAAPASAGMIAPRRLGALEVTGLGLGVQNMARTYQTTVPARADMIALIRAAHDGGVGFFDTAEAYGPHECERILGEAAAPFRDSIKIATKFGWNIDQQTGARRPGLNSRPAHVRLVVEGMLKRLNTDRIDLLYQHRVDPEVPIEDVASRSAAPRARALHRWLRSALERRPGGGWRPVRVARAAWASRDRRPSSPAAPPASAARRSTCWRRRAPWHPRRHHRAGHLPHADADGPAAGGSRFARYPGAASQPSGETRRIRPHGGIDPWEPDAQR